ncbi:hypothetical protein Fmac_019370 [Flemingia macrophylla]|uniref:Uncharacterized protein n=1 Tax=Flemingia macrophylla TaxID=520843 RepID=A0ABD1M7M9_9FABA
MNKFGLIFLVATYIKMLRAMALVAEAPMPGLNPLELQMKRETHLSDEKSYKIEEHEVAVSREDSKEEEAEGPDIRRLGKHHSTDKSVAGGGVILGGLVTVIFAAVFCYIRVTRKRDSDDH